MSELRRVLAPITLDDFVERYWEQQPLHVARDDAAYFSDIYAIGDIEDALVTGANDLERFALVRAGAPQAPLDAYVVERPAIRGASTGKRATTTIDARKVLALFERGYTLVINDAALLTPRLGRICSRLQRDLGAFVGANVYLTPAGAQGLAAHHDTHDTLTVQIAGSKAWRIFEPVVPLPLESQALDGNAAAAAQRTPERIVTLAPGDTLYLPRGYVHEAVAADARTLHVTFALAPVRVIDLLRTTLEMRAEADVALRRSLPFGWQHDPAFASSFSAALSERAAEHFSAAAIEDGARAALHDQFAASRAGADDLFERPSRVAGLHAGSMLTTAPDAAFLLRDHALAPELLLPGTALALPAGCAAAFERLLAGPVRFGDLALPLSEPDRTLFIAALVRAGIVRVSRTRP